MIFKPELANAILAGRKTVTRRLVSDNPRSPWHPDRAPKLVGKRVAIQPGRGKQAIGSARVLAVSREPRFIPVRISHVEARREGCVGRTHFEVLWERLHGDPTRPYDVWRLALLIDPDDRKGVTA